MPGFGDDAESARIAFGTLWNHRIARGHKGIDQLDALADILLDMRAKIAANGKGIFVLPDDLDNANADLQALKNHLLDFVNSLPGGP